MANCTDDYTAHYRWEWFCRARWRRSFRERKRHSSGAFVELVKERGIEGQPILDCSCGLGLKTIVMREAGLNVAGSDCCAFAVEHARLLADEEGHPDLTYFVSSWAELPEKSPARYAAVFNDALSWVHADEEMASALSGIHDCLAPGGLLAYMGALPGTSTNQDEILERQWQTRIAEGRHRLGLSARDGTTAVQEVVFFEKGPDFIDEHHLYVVDEDSSKRIETWCLRCAVKWSWPRIEPLLKSAGFVSFEARELIAANGKPFHLVVARRS